MITFHSFARSSREQHTLRDYAPWDRFGRSVPERIMREATSGSGCLRGCTGMRLGIGWLPRGKSGPAVRPGTWVRSEHAGHLLVPHSGKLPEVAC